MEVVFRAIDGQEFTDIYACEHHEAQLKNNEIDKTKIVILFDEKGKKLNFNKTNLLLCYYIFIKENVSDNYLYKLLNEENAPLKKGLYYYDDDEADKWINLNDSISELKERLRLFYFIKRQCAD